MPVPTPAPRSLIQLSLPFEEKDILPSPGLLQEKPKPFQEKHLTIGTKCGIGPKGEIYPELRFGGVYLEKANFRVGKKVTISLRRNKIIITVDKPQPEPHIEEGYEKARKGRQVMQEIQQKFLGPKKEIAKKPKRKAK